MDRETLAREGRKNGFAGYWLDRDELEAPKSAAVPFCWRWSAVYPLLQAAATLIPVEEAHRRALLLVNPGLKRPFVTSTLYGGYSLYNPGEIATVHRHMSSASRFALLGNGGYTTVEGEKCFMSRGDLILTPNGAWHDHGNEGTDPLIWVDILDLPLTESLNAQYFDFDYREPSRGDDPQSMVSRELQTIRAPDDYSVKLYSTGGLLPLFEPGKRGKGFGSPQYVYRWKDTLNRLKELRSFEGGPYDGIALEYVNPVTGESALPTLSFRAQLLRPGQALQWHRTTANTVYCVMSGRGKAEFDDLSLEWEENDIFLTPSWRWSRIVNLSDQDDLLLFSASDGPALKKLGYLRAQSRTDGGQVTELLLNNQIDK